jgi:hypothetical protein
MEDASQIEGANRVRERPTANRKHTIQNEEGVETEKPDAPVFPFYVSKFSIGSQRKNWMGNRKSKWSWTVIPKIIDFPSENQKVEVEYNFDEGGPDDCKPRQCIDVFS